MATSATVIGGYDCEYFIDTLPEQLQCTICMLVPRDVHYTECCYKMFCGSCLDHLKRVNTHYTCPNCRGNLSNHCHRDQATNEAIEQLRVSCNYKKGGCEWSGRVKELEKHMKRCTHKLKACPNNCSELIYPVELEKHLKDICTHRSTTCPYCHITDIHKIITGSHYSECTEVPIACPNKECDEIHVRRLMEDHRDVCSKEIVFCPYVKVGCQEKVKRESLRQHEEENIKEHLRVAMKRIEKLSLENVRISTQQSQRNTFKLEQFETLKENNKIWYSSGIYTSPGGYKLCLSVYVNGNGEAAINSYISCFAHLMSGEYDDILEWPFQGEVTVELLNQLEDKNHEKEVLRFHKSTPVEYRQRVSEEGKLGRGGGVQCFISHSQLGYNSSLNCQYLKDDTLYFRVSVKVTTTTKPWLVT